MWGKINDIEYTVYIVAGGELASCVHRFVRHGDERVAMLARRLLTALTYPLLLMLTRWLIHGNYIRDVTIYFLNLFI